MDRALETVASINDLLAHIKVYVISGENLIAIVFDKYSFNEVLMKAIEIFQYSVLNETVSDQIIAKAQSFVNAVKRMSGMQTAMTQADSHRQELLNIFQNCVDAEDLKMKIRQLGQTMTQVHEGVGSKIAKASLLSLAGVGAVICAKLVGIYNQMGQPDVIDGSHLNMVGGMLFGVLPAVLCTMLAIFIALDSRA